MNNEPENKEEQQAFDFLEAIDQEEYERKLEEIPY